IDLKHYYLLLYIVFLCAVKNCSIDKTEEKNGWDVIKGGIRSQRSRYEHGLVWPTKFWHGRS
ncbi:hypothetical protein, partial [Parasutterella excrementihominis]|uniref:hypothetical protein n=1 Tax=Parasutterella excrementihominis TaxID=487175 RepID=UPI003AB399AB